MAVKFTESFRKGNIFTKLSILIPGLGNLVGKQIINSYRSSLCMLYDYEGN